MRPERGPPSRPSRRTHVRVEPGAKPFVDDLLLGRGFVRSRAAPSLRSIESQPSTQGFVFLSRSLFPHHPKAWGNRGRGRSARADARRGLHLSRMDAWLAGGRARAGALAPVAVAAAAGGTRDPPAVGRGLSLPVSRRRAPPFFLPLPPGERLGSAAAPSVRSPSRHPPTIRALAKPRVLGYGAGGRRRRRPRAMAGLARVPRHTPVPSELEVLSPGGWGGV